jgi:hypothetical protein
VLQTLEQALPDVATLVCQQGQIEQTVQWGKTEMSHISREMRLDLFPIISHRAHGQAQLESLAACTPQSHCRLKATGICFWD